MKREFLESMNSILEFIHSMDPSRSAELHAHMIADGFGYPERTLTRLQEEITDRLSEFD